MLTDFAQMFHKHRIYPAGILHLGASDDAREADFYAKFCPSAQTILVEAIPKVHARLVQKIEKYSNQLALCACVSDKDAEKVTFRVADNAGMSSSILPFGTHAKEHPDVKFIATIQMETVRVDTLLAARNIKFESPSFLDIDLQGCELRALKGMGSVLDQFDWVYSEFSETEVYVGCVLEPELDAFMKEKGFVVADRWPTRHSWGDKIFVRVDTRAKTLETDRA